MLKYAFELSDDPQKEKVYNRLVKAMISLADDVKEDIIRSNNLLNYYNLKIVPESVVRTQSFQMFQEWLTKLLLQKESQC